jgi:hypothetical protein
MSADTEAAEFLAMSLGSETLKTYVPIDATPRKLANLTGFLRRQIGDGSDVRPLVRWVPSTQWLQFIVSYLAVRGEYVLEPGGFLRQTGRGKND